MLEVDGVEKPGSLESVGEGGKVVCGECGSKFSRSVYDGINNVDGGVIDR